MPTDDWSPGELHYGGNTIPVRDLRISYERPRPTGLDLLSGSQLDEIAPLYQLRRYSLRTAPRDVAIEFEQVGIGTQHRAQETDDSLRERLKAAVVAQGVESLWSRLFGEDTHLARAARDLEEQGQRAFTNPNLEVPFEARPQRYSLLDGWDDDV